MIIVDTIPDLRSAIRQWREAGQSVAFVPTMGNLHTGHICLVEQGKQCAHRVVASIFVNPLQFGPNEDFQAYPRTPRQDENALRAAGADLLFTPPVEILYPADLSQATYVEVPGLSGQLCGEFRPGHFRGVATIVCKLLNMVQPDLALFGEKDYQQLTIIRKMVADLNMPVAIQAVPTVREASGLAMSSRNGYLTEAEREQAAAIYQALIAAAVLIKQGNRDYRGIELNQQTKLAAAGLRSDYFAIRRADDLSLPQPGDHKLVLLVAAWLGRARLIDNLTVELDLAAPSA